MPILTIEIVHRSDETLPWGLAQRLADAAGEALGAPPGRTWVKLQRISAADYAESGTANAITPVFVHVLLAQAPGQEQRQGFVERLTGAVAAACNRPAENVHIIFEPAAAGRVAFGGKLVE